jgi:3-methylcrotonyl-CoA carboxylase alpha subunit
MRVVEQLDRFDEALESAKREALAAFGDASVLLERYLREPRHIEFQILADLHGTTLHLGERECSIQRRHQKIVEEAPSVALTPKLRAEMGAAAVRAAESVQYSNAGTCEFMLDGDGRYYFLEMNARLQVEHPVTELAYGLDLVHWQLRIADGERLTLPAAELRPRGWAIEARVYAEDPANDMLPSTGRIAHWVPPEGPGIRVDAGVAAGSEVSHYYDPMLAKLIVYGDDRPAAIARLQHALATFVVDGVRTNLPLLLWIARDNAFARGETTTNFLGQRLDESIFAHSAPPPEAALLCAAALLADGRGPWRIADVGIPIRLASDSGTIEFIADATGDPRIWLIGGDRSGELRTERHGEIVRAQLDGASVSGAVACNGREFAVHLDGRIWSFRFAPPPAGDSTAGAQTAAGDAVVTAPMPGRIVKIAIREGEAVEEHALLLVLEAMKMEHRIEASTAAVVKSVLVREGQIVAAGTPLVDLGS